MPKRAKLQEAWYAPPQDDVCPLCGRVLPPEQRDAHHLVPKMKGGRETQHLHRICHRQIHALFTEAELAKTYNTVEALLAHPQIQKFVSWVRRKPIGFMERTRTSHLKRQR
ncbi:MAG: HNH endonuclease signature motif containing protein [Tardiphaga sp.]